MKPTRDFNRTSELTSSSRYGRIRELDDDEIEDDDKDIPPRTNRESKANRDPNLLRSRESSDEVTENEAKVTSKADLLLERLGSAKRARMNRAARIERLTTSNRSGIDDDANQIVADANRDRRQILRMKRRELESEENEALSKEDDFEQENEESIRLLNEEKDADNFEVLTKTMVAKQVFRDNFYAFPDEEKSYQPLLTIPGSNYDTVCKTCSFASILCACFAPSQSQVGELIRFDEMDVIESTVNINRLESIAKIDEELAKILSVRQDNLSNEQKASSSGVSFIKPGDKLFDGIYNGRGPVLKDILLHGVNVSEKLREFLPTNQMRLSRITQRILTELKVSIEEERRYRQLLDSSSISRLSALNLLNRSHVGPIFRLYENPLDMRLTQPCLHDPHPSYGGEIGNWRDDVAESIRLGNFIPKRNDGKKKRALLNIHLYQMNILEHPLMISEERYKLSLDGIYCQYKALLDEHVFAYLSYRLEALLSEYQMLHTSLQHLLRNYQAETDEEEAIQKLLRLKTVHNDLIESIQTTADALNSFNILSKNLYDTWRKIQDIRRQQGFISTRTQLKARRTSSNSKGNNDLSKASRGDQNALDPMAKRRSIRENRTNEVASDTETNLPSNNEDQWKSLQSKLSSFTSCYDESVTTMQDMYHTIERALDEKDAKPSKKQSSLISQRSRKLLKSLSRMSSITIGVSSKSQSKSLGGIHIDPRSKTKEKLIKSIETILSYRNLLPEVVFRVSDDGEPSVDVSVPPEELQRRQLWQLYSWKLSISLDHTLFVTTDPIQVQAFPYHLSLMKSYEIRVAHVPREINVNLYCATSLHGIQGNYSLLGTMNIPSHTLAETQTVTHASNKIFGWFSCMSEKNIYRPYPSIIDWMLSSQDNATATRLSAALLCSVEYSLASNTMNHSVDGVKPDQVAIIPSRANRNDHDNKLLQLDQQRLQSPSLILDKDYQALLPDVFLLDPNDPKNDSLLYTELRGKQRLLDSDIFNLGPSNDIVWAHTENGIGYDDYMQMKMSLRLRLLRIRKPIPMNDETIQKSEILKEILEKNHPSVDLLTYSLTTKLDDSDEMNEILKADISKTKSKITDFLQRVRNSRAASDRTMSRKAMTSSSIVAEKDYFARRDDNGFFSMLIPPRKRALKPIPRIRTPMAQQVQSCNLLIQVVGARNIPLREDSSEPNGSSKTQPTVAKSMRRDIREGIELNRTRNTVEKESYRDNNMDPSDGFQDNAANRDEQNPLLAVDIIDDAKMKEQYRARTFIEIKFQEHTFITPTKDGSTPIWKQLLSLPFHPPQDDFSPSNLLQIHENVTFTLFDEVLEDDSERTGFLEGEITERTEKRYLGRFSVPFATIYTTGRIEGTFRVDTPAFSFGYNHLHSRSKITKKSSFDESLQNLLQHASRTTTIWKMIFDCDCLGKSNENVLEMNNYANSVSDLKGVNPNQSSSRLLGNNLESELAYFVASDHSATYLKILITLDPLLMAPPSPTQLSRYELITTSVIPQDKIHISYAKRWLDRLKHYGDHVLNRSYLLFATNSSGQEVFIPRYLIPQRPPPGFYSRRACIHLTTLIPFLRDNLSFSDDIDLWCTAKQMWEIGAGDEEEHAVLLYNYLYYLTHYSSNKSDAPQQAYQSGNIARKVSNVSTIGGTNIIVGYPSPEILAKESIFLVYGNGIPEGKTVYVLVRLHQIPPPQVFEPRNYILINPNTGYVYSAADRNCPLKSVYTLTTPYNIWANIQPNDSPNDILYNVQQPTMWQSFFNDSYPYPSNGLQTIQDDVFYVETKKSYAMEIENALKDSIKINLRKWRSKRQRSATIFHPDACAAVTEILSRLEQWKRTGEATLLDQIDISSSTNPMNASFTNQRRDGDDQPIDEPSALEGAMDIIQYEIQSKLRSVLRTRVLRGFPLNMPFTDIDTIITEIKSLCIHENKHPEAQFVLGVRAFPIVNNIVSIWIFLGTLESIN